MVRFTDDANRFWLEQSLDKGEMPKRDRSETLTLCGVTFSIADLPITYDFGEDHAEHGHSHRYMRIQLTK